MQLKITYQISPGLSRVETFLTASSLGYNVADISDLTMTFDGVANEQTVEDFQPLINQLAYSDWITEYAVIE